MAKLSAEQIKAFKDNGYLVVENVVGEAALKAVEAEYDAILDAQLPRLVAEGQLSSLPKGSFAERYVEAMPQLEDMYDLYQHIDISLPLLHEMDPGATLNAGPAVFTHILRNPGILDIAESLLGPEITSSPVQHTRIKPPQVAIEGQALDSNVAKTNWHQDEAVIEEVDDIDMLTVWVAMTDATPEMGCMICVPGSHKAEELTTMHCPGNGFSSAEIYIPDDIVGKGVVPMPVSRGGVVLLDQRTIHGSFENTSDKLRWSFDLRYIPTGQQTGRPVFPSFVARSASAPETELRDPAAYAAAWEAARDHLAAQGEVAFNERWKRYSDHPLCA